MDDYMYATVEMIEARLAQKWAEIEEQEERAVAAQHTAISSESTIKENRDASLTPDDSPLFVGSETSPSVSPHSLQGSLVSAVDEVGVREKGPSMCTKDKLTIKTTSTAATNLLVKRKRSDLPGPPSHTSVFASPAGLSPTHPSPLSNLPPIRKRSKSSVQSPISLIETRIQDSATRELIPEWYQKLKSSTKRNLVPGDRQKLDRLTRIIDLIKEAQRLNSARNKQASAKTFEEISETLHELEFLKVKAIFIAQKRLLDSDRGLPQIFTPKFSGGVDFPAYIQDDAKLLWTRWCNKIFEQNLFIGIQNMLKPKTGNGRGPSIDPKFKKDWRYFGARELVNGQWWGSQLCAVRDGAHGSAQGGIAGVSGEGATSIVLSGDMYKTTDRDEGEEIWYSGTKNVLNASEPTKNTQLLLQSIASKLPVRVMRSANLPDTNKFKPAKGFRYDGVYEVLGSQSIDLSTQHRLFHLRRLPDQTPIRNAGVETRPTKQEMDGYDLDMRKYGWKGGMPE
jgi:hypothetical protein